VSSARGPTFPLAQVIGKLGAPDRMKLGALVNRLTKLTPDRRPLHAETQNRSSTESRAMHLIDELGDGNTGRFWYHAIILDDELLLDFLVSSVDFTEPNRAHRWALKRLD
jgi:hypothetical protein